MTVKICHGINVSFDAVFIDAAVPTLLILEAVNDGNVPDHDAEEILDSNNHFFNEILTIRLVHFIEL